MSKLLKKIFPYTHDITFENLQFDSIGLYSITLPAEATIITEIIETYSGLEATITDCTAGLGGNTLSFATKFSYVNAIEIDNDRFPILTNNIAEYKYNNITLFKGSCLSILPNITQDIIFVDPPWGGPSYKESKNLEIYLDNIEISELVTLFLNHCKILALKLPLSYDTSKIKGTVIIHKLKNMQLVIIK